MRQLIRVTLLLAAVKPCYAPDPAVSFELSFNRWIHLHQSYQPSVLNAAELRAWNQVKSDWRVLQRAADELY